jgi:DNA topoisomerase-1
LRVVGTHPDGKPIEAGTGRYGPFVKHGNVYANLPKERSPDEVGLEEALRLIEERSARAGGGKAKRGRSAPAAKTAAAPKAKAKGAPKAKAKPGAKPKAGATAKSRKTGGAAAD